MKASGNNKWRKITTSHSFNKIKNAEAAWQQQLNQFSANQFNLTYPTLSANAGYDQPQKTHCTLRNFYIADGKSYRTSLNEEKLSLQLNSSCNEKVLLTIETISSLGKQSYQVKVLPNNLSFLDITVAPGRTRSEITGFTAIKPSPTHCNQSHYYINTAIESYNSPNLKVSVKSSCPSSATAMYRFELLGNDSLPEIRYLEIRVPANGENQTVLNKIGLRSSSATLVDIH